MVNNEVIQCRLTIVSIILCSISGNGCKIVSEIYYRSRKISVGLLAIYPVARYLFTF